MNPYGQLELERLPLLNRHKRYERRRERERRGREGVITGPSMGQRIPQ